MKWTLTSIGLIVTGCPALAAPVSRSAANPKLLSFRGNDHVKLIGYDDYDLLNTEHVSQQIDWRKKDDDKRPLYESFFDLLAENGVNFTRCFVWCGWANDLFCWKRISTPDDPIKAGQRYSRVDLAQFDERFWNHAIKAIQYAASKGVIVEVTLYDRCSIDSDAISPRRWSFHPWNPDNSLPGTIGYDLLPRGKQRGIPFAFDLSNPKIKSLHEAYLKKWVDSIRHLDNVIFEIENEGYSGYELNKWVAQYLRHSLQCPFLLAENSFAEKDRCHAIPEVDIIADHGEKSPREVDQLAAQWSHFGKIIMIDTDGWRTSEENYKKSLQTAQRTMDLDLHFNHKARSNRPCGDTGRRYIELMQNIQRGSDTPATYRADAVMANSKAVEIVLGKTNIEQGLTLHPAWSGSLDGWTAVVERQGKTGRSNDDGPDHRKGRTIYFDVDDRFMFNSKPGPVQIEVEYYDATRDELELVYDASGPSPSHDGVRRFTCQGTTDWQHAVFDLNDAYFGNRCGEHADFGLRSATKDGEIIIRQVWVRKGK